MNKELLFVLFKNIYIVVLIIALVVLGIYMFITDSLYFNNNDASYEKDLSMFLLYGASGILILLGIFFTIRFESHIKEKELEENLNKYNLLNDEMDFFNNEIPLKIIQSNFCIRIREFCDEAWKRGDVKVYLHNKQLFSEVLNYAYLMKDEDRVVSWREELDCMSKMIYLLNNCCENKQVKVDLFEMSTNYRFPIGLFVVPLFNAIENSININGCSLKMECFNIGGYWNCIIGSEHADVIVPDENRSYVGYKSLQKRVDLGNWPIELGLSKHDMGVEMTISGKYAV